MLLKLEIAQNGAIREDDYFSHEWRKQLNIRRAVTYPHQSKLVFVPIPCQNLWRYHSDDHDHSHLGLY